MHNTFFVCLLIFIFLYSCVVSYYCYKFAMILIKLEDVVEESLTKLESIKSQFEDILEIPVFFDSVEIRKCIQLIKTAKVVVEEIIEDTSKVFGAIQTEETFPSESTNKFAGEKIESEGKKEDNKV